MRNFNISCQGVGLFFNTPFRKTHWLSLKFEDPLKQNKKCTLQTKGGCSLSNKESARYAKTEEMLMPYLKFLIGRLKCFSSFSEGDSAASVTSMVSLCIAGSNPEMDSCVWRDSFASGFPGWLHLGCGSNQLYQTACLHSEASGHCFHSRTGVEVSASQVDKLRRSQPGLDRLTMAPRSLQS